MEYYYILEFLRDFFNRKIRHCRHCDSIMFREKIKYRDKYLCSYKCLTEYYEDVYVRKN